ncbi:MAG TPA: cytochrome c [Acidobacteriaceae bacterium]|jgi:cytochrome c oxidase cbb3-type subunit 3/ubiquinol-cytochrome c reductase cytochrome c subunit
MRLPFQRAITTLLMAGTTALVLAGCNGAPGKPGPHSETPRPEQVADFATLYNQNCASCHGVNGKNGAALSLANPVYLAIAGAANIERVTANGVPGTMMPPFAQSKGGTLTDHQIAILAAGMQQAWGNPNALSGQTPPAYASNASGNAAQGEKSYALFCARCHGTDGAGTRLDSGVVTGSLVDPSYLALVSDQGLRSFILAGQTAKGPHDWRSYVTTPAAGAMTDQEIADTVAWLTSHRIATPGQVYQQHP